jgi:hypothetical protein
VNSIIPCPSAGTSRTVMAEGAEAGDVLHASEFSLPAATATIIPAARIEAMPRFIEDEKPPPIDILATHLLDANRAIATVAVSTQRSLGRVCEQSPPATA